MKDSGIEWIGEIPESWILTKYKFFSQSRMGETILASETVEKGIPIYSATQEDKIFGYVENATVILHKNDFVIPARGNSIGCVTIVKDEVATCTQTTICSTDIHDIDIKYLYYCCWGLKFEWFKYVGSAIPQITVDQIKNNILPYPPLSEQQAISAFLDRQCAHIENIIEKTKASIEEYKKLRQAVITQAVTKGVCGDRPMKDSGIEWIGEIPEEWNYQKLKTVLSMPVIDGPHESPELYDEGIPYISATAIENNKINFELMRGYISEEYCSECDKRYKPQVNDILLIKLGASTGQVAIVDTDRRFNIWVPLAAIRCNENAVPKFIYYGFQAEYLIRQMELSWTFGTQQTLGVKTVEQLRFALPSIVEQQEIAAYLDQKCAEIDTLITKKESFLTELESYKKSIIYEYVTGKKEVPSA